MTTASPPTWVVTVRRASSLTAMRPEIFSRLGRMMGYAVCIVRDRSIEVWKVATMGPSAAIRASTLMLGVTGSCRCSTSKCPASSHRLTLAAVTGPKLSRATEPL